MARVDADVLGWSVEFALHDVPQKAVVVGGRARVRPDGEAIARILRTAQGGGGGGPAPLVVGFVEEPQIIPGRTGAIGSFWSGMYHGVYR